MRQKEIFRYIVVFFKGMAMGAADVVPGVSGGTIAFIAGIYEELIESINAFNFSLIPLFKQKGIKGVWQRINGNFLTALFLGIALSVVSLAKTISWLLEHKPVLLWSFFFGLVLASIWFVARQIQIWHFKTIVALFLGAIFAYVITSLEPGVSVSVSAYYLILSGALAICAMILPGISGSFILVLLGVYELVLNAVHQRNLYIIMLVGTGAIAGLLSFAKLLKYIFARYRNLTLAVLTGFIVGALPKIWPWKNVLDTLTIAGKTWVRKTENVSPFHYNGNAQLTYAVLWALAGFLLIILLEKWEEKQKK